MTVHFHHQIQWTPKEKLFGLSVLNFVVFKIWNYVLSWFTFFVFQPTTFATRKLFEDLRRILRVNLLVSHWKTFMRLPNRFIFSRYKHLRSLHPFSHGLQQINTSVLARNISKLSVMAGNMEWFSDTILLFHYILFINWRNFTESLIVCHSRQNVLNLS